MQAPSHSLKHVPIRSPTPPLGSSTEELDEISLEQELDKLDDIPGETKKPHFLDYDAVPPPHFNEPLSALPKTAMAKDNPKPNMHPGENLKIDKIYERDGEVSDFELSASALMKSLRKEKIAAEQELQACSLKSMPSTSTDGCGGARRKKHFLDENPIPPNYDYDREHRSLDRHFERPAREPFDAAKFDRKHSLDRGRPKKQKEMSYTLSQYLESDDSVVYRGTWPSDRPHDTLVTASSKVNGVYTLLSMLGQNNSNPLQMSSKFLELSRSPETCVTLRHSCCISLLVQMIHSDADDLTRRQASMALHNVVNCHPEDKAGRREAKVLRHIEELMKYCDLLRNTLKGSEAAGYDKNSHPLTAMNSLMKISFDEEHRHAMCLLGALQAIASIVHYDHAVHGANSKDTNCISLRRFAGMALTNLTFGDGNNKALLCANKEFMKALVAQIDTSGDDLLQVTANVLRNLSWRADPAMKDVLNEIGTVTALAKAAMKNKNENTLRAILSALWNLSAHCSTNKAEFCMVDGALSFLVGMLTFESPSKTLTIIENAGGILRNVSSHIAVNEDYRKILRQHNCLGILLQQLESPSLTVVSNACGTLWNLSARCPEDQKFLWENNAVPMLRSLIHSKHNMISNGSRAAMKNLLNFRPGEMSHNIMDPIAKSMGLKELPSLKARKQRALQQELDQNLSETCENIEVTTPTKEEKPITELVRPPPLRLTHSAKSDSHDSIRSTKSDSAFERQRDADVAAANKRQRPTTAESYMKPKATAQQKNSQKTPSTDETGDTEELNEQDEEAAGKAKYQETDLDEITDFSVLYAENQNDRNEVPVRNEGKPKTNADQFGGENLLMLDDTVKCYETEGTPYISKAGSITDLRAKPSAEVTNKNLKGNHIAIESSGINTPEKPAVYAEEGTPGYFSHHDSFSSLDEEPSTSPPMFCERNEIERPNMPVLMENQEAPATEQVVAEGTGTQPTTPGATASKAVTFNDYALETPLMFSRHSSVESLTSMDHDVMVDDRSSVVSEVSRMTSGIMSPSELPPSISTAISPSQSPRRISSRLNSPPPHQGHGAVRAPDRLRSVFEDEVNTFGVENTPAQFSCATSLSNLSLNLDDEPKIATDSLMKEMKLMSHPSEEHDEIGVEVIGAQQVDAIVQQGPSISNSAMSQQLVTSTVNDGTHSDSEDSVNDSMLLETCINIGMNKRDHGQDSAPPLPPRTMPKAPPVPSRHDESSSSDLSDGGNESLLQQCIRDGIQRTSTIKPVPLPRTTANVTEHHSMLPRTVTKEHPIGMMRQGGHAFGSQVDDEVRGFNVEDSPCNFSMVSGLSDLTTSSHVAGLVQPNRDRPIDRELHHQADDNHSLSSLSVDSEDDNRILSQAIAAGAKSNTNAAPLPPKRMNSQQTGPSTSNCNRIPGSMVVQRNFDANDSYSSIDSTDSNDQQTDAILQQVIRAGMQKEAIKPLDLKPEKASSNLSPKRSQLPMSKTPAQLERERERARERERKDEELLKQCIETGMGNVRLDAEIKPPIRHVRQTLQPQTDYSQRINQLGSSNPHQLRQQPQQNIQLHQNQQENSQNIPKNEETTPAAVSATMSAVDALHTAPGVGKELPNGTNATEIEHHLQQSPVLATNSPNHQHTINGVDITVRATRIGCDLNESTNSFEALHKSYGSLKTSAISNVLERSNEFPALKVSNIDFDDSFHDSSMEMEVSNEFLTETIDDISPQKMDKHKDPELMLRSVERLTQELVSTAEYLRTNALSISGEDELTHTKKSSSSSNNTWNEDTCLNDASFPSISLTAPIIASMHDDDNTFSDTNNGIMFETKGSAIEEEPTPTNEVKHFLVNGSSEVDGILENAPLEATLKFIPRQPDSLESDTLCDSDASSLQTSGSGINFQVGGKVQQQTFRDGTGLSSGPYSFDTYSTMTNSTIIAMEANKLCTDLLNMQAMADSSNSLDLDNIRPPSAMEQLSMSGCFEMPQSPQLSRLRKKSLPHGLMARRALTYFHPSGSLESVNSSCNLDNIKPPSLMDELLDSMISVDSIASEVAEDTVTIHPEDSSHIDQFETAHSEIDDTMTLRSCMDLPMDQTTPIPSDFSSAESTPRKTKGVKRTITPRQRRQATKDRFRTYTIAADEKDSTHDFEVQSKDSACEDDLMVDENMIHIEIDEGSPKKLTPRQRRQEDRSRFQTQVLDSEMIARSSSSIDSSPQSPRRNRNDPRYLTRTISHQENGSCPSVDLTPIRNRSHECLLNDDSDCASQISNDDDMSSIKALTRPFKHLRDIKIDINPKPPVITDERPENCSEGNLNSLEFEQNSETESFDQNYPEDDQTYTIQRPKPRITKPMERDPSNESKNGENSDSSPEGKGIRGRKKATYVSPYRMTGTVEKTSPRVSISPKTQTEAAKKVSPLARPPANQGNVISKAGLTNKINTVKVGLSKPGFSSKLTKKNPVAEKNLINTPSVGVSKGPEPPIKAEADSTLSPPTMPNRQGTFVKDEPSNIDVPVVCSEPTTPSKQSKVSSKIPNKLTSTPTPGKGTSFISKLKLPLQRTASNVSPPKSAPAKVTSTKTTPGKRFSMGSVYKSPSAPFVSQRSNSNASMKSTVSSTSSTKQHFASQPQSRSNSNLAIAKRDITSRIAGLWKKTDDKKKSISSPSAKMPNKTLTAASKPPSGSKLLRSSTFDNTDGSVNLPKVKIPVISSTTKPKDTTVVRRVKAVSTNADETKRISRLGSFIIGQES